MGKEGNSRPVDCVERLWLGVDSGRESFQKQLLPCRKNIDMGKGVDRGFFSTLAMPAKCMRIMIIK